MSDYLGSEPAGIAMQNASHSGKIERLEKAAVAAVTEAFAEAFNEG